MILDIKGSFKNNGKIIPLVNYLEKSDDLQQWIYSGLTVEIDPTVDYTNQNILIRWLDINEGFNDKLIVNSKEAFLSQFTPILND